VLSRILAKRDSTDYGQYHQGDTDGQQALESYEAFSPEEKSGYELNTDTGGTEVDSESERPARKKRVSIFDDGGSVDTDRRQREEERRRKEERRRAKKEAQQRAKEEAALVAERKKREEERQKAEQRRREAAEALRVSQMRSDAEEGLRRRVSLSKQERNEKERERRRSVEAQRLAEEKERLQIAEREANMKPDNVLSRILAKRDSSSDSSRRSSSIASDSDSGASGSEKEGVSRRSSLGSFGQVKRLYPDTPPNLGSAMIKTLQKDSAVQRKRRASSIDPAGIPLVLEAADPS
jgi:hypothetical protein